jgi:hypothetical protein
VTDDAPAPKAGTLAVELAGRGPYAQAIIAAPAPAADKPERIYFDLTVSALGGPGGLLAKALASQNATAEPRLIGGRRAAAVVIDVRAPEPSLEPAVAQVRGALQRMRQGALGAADLDRAVALLSKRDLDASFDPRQRLAALWAGAAPAAPAPSLEAWRGWVASGLAEERLVVVIGKAKK